MAAPFHILAISGVYACVVTGSLCDCLRVGSQVLPKGRLVMYPFMGGATKGCALEEASQIIVLKSVLRSRSRLFWNVK